MNRERLLDAFSELDGKTVRSAAALLGYEEEAMKRKRIKPILRAALIAAVIGVLMMGTAYAAGLFSMQVRTPKEGEDLVVHDTYYDETLGQNVTMKLDLTHSPLVLQFTGEGEIHRIQFRPGWLPKTEVYAHESFGDEEDKDWLWYYTCFFDRSRSGGGVEYQIECHYAWPGFTVYMDGLSAHVVKEEDWDNLHITEIEQVSRWIAADGSQTVYRYVLVFDPNAGWFVSIAGTADFETLEHIAREMEFITLDELAEPSGGDYSYLGVGVG